MSGQSYTAELRTTERELKIVNAKANGLRKKKKELQRKLYDYMVRHKVSEIEGYNIEKIAPPAPKPKPKKPSEKKKDAIDYFKQLGIRNPEACYNEFLSTQKSQEEDE